jgi:hypothetical protein
MKSAFFVGLIIAGGGLCAGCGSKSTTAPPNTGSNSASTTVQTGQEGVVENASGVRLSVLPTTVPTDPTSASGQLVFSIEPTSATGTVPAGHSPVGQAWQLGPEGIHFAARCRVSVPVPDTLQRYVLGRLNSVTHAWEVVPTSLVSVNPPRIAADVLHLSTWQPFSVSGLSPQSYGAVHVQNVDGTRSVSLCIKSYQLKYPEFDLNFSAEATGMVVTEAGHNGGIAGVLDHADWYLPQGTYVLEATRSIAHNPLAEDAVPDGWVDLDTVAIGAPNRFGAPPPVSITLDPSAWQNVNYTPLMGPSQGTPDYSFGTGDVQVTLTWDLAADLDLHVTEPSGEEIFFYHTQSATGGMLDRDRQCDPADLGRPENVFWPKGRAPHGTFAVKVHYFAACQGTSGSVPFRVRTVVDGAAHTYTGSLNVYDTTNVVSFVR